MLSVLPDIVNNGTSKLEQQTCSPRSIVCCSHCGGALGRILVIFAKRRASRVGYAGADDVRDQLENGSSTCSQKQRLQARA